MTEPNRALDNMIASATSRIGDALAWGALDLIDGRLVDRVTDWSWCSIWGSSTMHGLGPELERVMRTEAGVEHWYDGSHGGESVSHISARMGARRVRLRLVGGRIPSSGAVEVEHDLEPYGLEFLKPGFIGTLVGVSGELQHDPTVGSQLSFRRSRPGTEVVTDFIHEFHPDIPEKSLCGWAFLNAGKIDAAIDDLTGIEHVFLRVVEMYEHLRPVFKRCLVLGNFVNGDAARDDPMRQQWVLDLNQRLTDHFGLRFVDLQAYLTGDQVWSDVGLTPTSEDDAYRGRGELAPSLQFNFAHISAEVSVAVVRHLLRPQLIELGWITPTR